LFNQQTTNSCEEILHGRHPFLHLHCT
jgi:hypothetical protein